MKAIKKNMNKWLGLVLAVAMVFSLNLTSMTAKAATTYTLPTETTEQALPSGVTGIKINTTTAKVYQDNNEDNSLFIRPTANDDLTVASLEEATITFTGSATVTAVTTGVTVSGNVVTADLLDKVAEVKVGDVTYKIAATPKDVKNTSTTSGITIAGKTATVTQNVFSNRYPGNAYYVANEMDWTVVNNYLTADLDDATTAAEVEIKDNGSLVDILDLQTGTGSVEIGGVIYTVLVTIPGEFHANEKNFWIDFKELVKYRNKENEYSGELAGSDWDTINEQMKEINAAQKAWYKTNPTFAEGVSCMDVLQNFLRFATTTTNPATGELYFTLGDTDCKDNCTYVSIIDGLEPFTLADGRDGWMYTNDPDDDTEPEYWYPAPIGAADYTMSSNSKIAWFFAADYTTHPW